METLALLLTDVVGSTRLWADEPDAMDAAMTRHHEIVHRAIDLAGGFRPVDQGEGDAVFAAFATPTGAIAAAVAIQRELSAEPWPTSRALTVRVGMHVGEVRSRGGNLFGDTVNRTARIRGLSHGGQVLLSRGLFELVRDALPVGVSGRDLGDHRMKDLTRPERIFQLDIEGLPCEFPALASLERAKHNLPVQVSSFVGRERDIAELREMLGEHRLVTITGFGGMGKTRLALQVAAELAEGDGDGVWFVDLSAETEPARVPSAIASVLGIAETGDGSVAAVLREVAGKKLLLVLDNLEQITGCATFVSELLAAAPGVHVLATSRSPLQVRGEHEYPIAPLAVAGDSRDPDSLGSYAAVRLFIDRAVEAKHDFAITNPTAPAIAEICDRLGGHPLSIELAAARIKVLSPHALLTRLDATLTLLTGGGPDRPERQQTLRATITWSYDLLSDPEKRLLDCLSVFPGTAGFEAIEAICGPLVSELDVLDGISSLVDNSLMRVHEPLRDDDPQVRYSLLVPIRAYAAERLMAAEWDKDVARRHAEYFRALQAAVPDETPEHGWAQNEETLREMHNLRAALAFYQQYGTAEDEAAFVDGMYADNLLVDGWLAEARELTLSVINQAPQPTRATALAHYVLTLLYDLSGRMEDSRREVAAAIQDAETAGEPAVAAMSAIAAMRRARNRTEFLQMVDAAAAAIDQVPPSGNYPARWNIEQMWDATLVDLTYVDHDRALAAARSLLASADAASDLEARVEAAHLIAGLLCDTGNYAAAAEQLIDFSDADLQAVPGLVRSAALLVRSRLKLGLGETEDAVRIATEALRLSEQYGAPNRVAQSWQAIAEGSCAANHAAAATDALQHAREALSGSDNVAGLGAIGWRLARLARWAEHPDPALLDDAWNHLVGKDWQRLPDVLGCMIEQAAHIAAEDPREAAQLLGLVQEHRRDFVLPMGVADDIQPLIAALRDVLGEPTLDQIMAACATEALPPKR